MFCLYFRRYNIITNNNVQAILKQGLMYTDCVTAYLNYLTEESNKKYYQYLPLPKPFKFKINIKMYMIKPMQS